MAISIDELQAIADSVRRAASEAGELQPTKIGGVSRDLLEAVRSAIGGDLASGAYQRAATEASAGDPELAQR